MKKYLIVIVFFFCIRLCGDDFFFENVTPDQFESLEELASESISVFNYEIVVDDDEDAKNLPFFPDEYFNQGVFRMLKGPNGIIGFYGLVRHFDEEDHTWINLLTHLYIRPEYMGQGYGRFLFQEAMRTAKEELHWEALLWETYPNAVEFYKKMGAKQVGETPSSLNPKYKVPVFVYVLD